MHPTNPSTDDAGRKQSWAALLTPANRVSWKADKVAIANAADIAYSTGSYLLADRTNPNKPPFDKGKFLEIWRKQSDGTWKCMVDTINTDLPLPTPGPPAK